MYLLFSVFADALLLGIVSYKRDSFCRALCVARYKKRHNKGCNDFSIEKHFLNIV